MAEFKRIKITFSYDGTNYHGMQIQPGKATIQSEIETALNTICRSATRITSAGRTDAGVHARAMTAHFDLDNNTDADQLQYRLNSLLPSDIRILSLTEVPKEFHARFSATSRSYAYTLITRPDPFIHLYTWEVNWILSLLNLNAAACLVLGEKDFSSCQIHSGSESTICNVTKSHWIKNDYLYQYNITADRFIHGMVRFLVGLQVAYARGAITLAEYTDALVHENSRARAFKAPAQGLCLESVDY